MTAIYTPLEPDEAKALIRLSIQERRTPRDQAAILIRQSLEKMGWLQPVAPAPANLGAKNEPA